MIHPKPSIGDTLFCVGSDRRRPATGHVVVTKVGRTYFTCEPSPEEGNPPFRGSVQFDIESRREKDDRAYPVTLYSTEQAWLDWCEAVELAGRIRRAASGVGYVPNIPIEDLRKAVKLLQLEP